jgi:predicted NodU family carbamoyl transferase
LSEGSSGLIRQRSPISVTAVITKIGVTLEILRFSTSAELFVKPKMKDRGLACDSAILAGEATRSLEFHHESA